MFGRGAGKGLGFGVGGLGFKGWLQGLRGLELIGLRLIRLEPLALPFPGPQSSVQALLHMSWKQPSQSNVLPP